MSNQRKVFYLLLTLLAVFFTPLIGLYVWTGEIPADFFDFPAVEATPKPGVNMLAIIISCLFWLAYLILIFFPKVYGFKRVAIEKLERKRVRWPVWFWIGFVCWGVIMIVFIAKVSQPKALVDWALVPLWWGFILMLDGIVYKRNNGKSLVRNAPTELISMGVLSVSGWMIFEYFNFFIGLNWYYPAARLIEHHNTFLLYALVGSSAFIPMAFEWYHLLSTFPALTKRYSRGPRTRWPLMIKIILVIVSFCALFFMSKNPDGLFYSIWLAPMIILIITLGFFKVWTPFTAVKEKGDWTNLVIFSLSWLLQGIFIEWWNHLSFKHSFIGTSNPGYWEYCLPYVHLYKVFNMPILGYLGYVPFSIYCCIWFILVSHMMNITHKFSFGHTST